MTTTAPQNQGTPGAEQPRVLLVDDELLALRTLSLIFERQGFQTATAATGREALAQARQQYFNLTLLDLKLPDMEGTEILARLKEFNPDMAVIMMTGYASVGTAIEALNAGAAAYITKPMNMDEVMARVREALEKQRLVIENRRLLVILQQELDQRRQAQQALKEANKQLQRALNAKEQMIQNVSHELRTPLALIKGYVELFQNGLLGPLTRDMEEAVETLDRQNQRLCYMVDRLLTLQACTPDSFSKVTFDLGHWVEDVLSNWQNPVKAKGVSLKWERPETSMPVVGDPLALSQVVDNLLDNAIKFSSTGGDVAVSVKLEYDEIIFQVADQGIGIEADQLDEIFNFFYQVDGSMTRRYGGIGIGLALCRAIVSAHDGRIWAESEGLNLGSRFSVALPAVTNDA